MNFGFSGEMIFLFFLALILFGPKKLPEIARTVARFMNEFRRSSNEFRAQIESEFNALDVKQHLPSNLPSVRQPLDSLASRILNPPNAEAKAVSEAGAEAKTVPETPPAPKVAPDA